MSQPQPQRKPKPPQPDSSNVIDIIVGGRGDMPVKPFPPEVRERINRQVVDSYAVDRDLIAKVKQLAIHLGRHKGDLICEGLDLVLEKYRDQLSELLAQQPPGDAAKTENGPPSV
ncbi:MAG TPA: hypothetical protein VMF69_27455 [Gemmataceae bacterium]|nr:hypothetical protein [Gemmataceae bacterium]